MTERTEALTREVGARAVALARCRLEVTSGPEKGAVRWLDGDVLRIGKSPDNDLVLDDGAVSRRHCEIVRERAGFLIRDLRSTNGTRLDGVEITEAWAKEGATLEVGKSTLRLFPETEHIRPAKSEAPRFGDAVGDSELMRGVFGLLARIAPTDATVLLGGETGTGKEILARAIHDASPRKDGPFIVLDGSAIPENLAESELFGHERGAFTGAAGLHRGAFERAHGGTLFLDEVGELPRALQPKLLRALEARSFRRVGGDKPLRVDIRVIAASKRHLPDEVAAGRFREDLYFRLAVVPLTLPPLRERLGDVPALANALLARLSVGASVSLSDDALNALSTKPWPGNVRELRNTLERAAYLAVGEGRRAITAADLLPPDAAEASITLSATDPAKPAVAAAASVSASEVREDEFDPALSYRETKAQFEADFERRFVTWLLDGHDGNLSAASRAAKMDRKYLRQLARKHGVI